MTLLSHLAGEADVKKMRAKLLKKLHTDKTKAAAGAPTSPEWTALQTAWETYIKERGGPEVDADAAPGSPAFRMQGKAFLGTWNGDFANLGPVALLAAIVALMKTLMSAFGMARWTNRAADHCEGRWARERGYEENGGQVGQSISVDPGSICIQ
jgi:hypothetical protein